MPTQGQPTGGGILDGLVDAGINAATGNVPGIVSGIIGLIGGGEDPHGGWFQINYPADRVSKGYYKWCQKYQPDKITSGDVWDEPNSIYKFRDAWKNAQEYVRALYGGTLNGEQEWQVIESGTFDQQMKWVAPGQQNTGQPGNTRVLAGGTVFPMPWEAGAWKAATMWHKLAWVGMFLVAPVLLVWAVVSMTKGNRRSGEKR